MSYKILTILPFAKQLKQLAKKYPSIPKDYENLLDSLEENPLQGESLGKKCYKIRFAISSKNRGKSGGGRVIVYVVVEDEKVYLLSIYDKSEQENITDQELEKLITFIRIKDE